MKPVGWYFIIAALFLFLVLALLPTDNIEGSERDSLVCGDIVNNNGIVDFADAVDIYRFATSTGIEPTMTQIIIGDLDGDGLLTVEDAILVGDHVVDFTEPQNCGNGVSVAQWQQTLRSEAVNSAQIASPAGIERVDAGKWNISSTQAVLAIDFETIRQRRGNELVNWDDVLVVDQRVWADHGDSVCPLRYFWLLAGKGKVFLVVRCYEDSNELIDFVDELYNPIVRRLTWYNPVEDLPGLRIGRILWFSLN